MSSQFDQAEIAKFTDAAVSWWDVDGPMRLLHRFNPLRLDFVQEQVGVLAGKRVLDIGCGGGIFTETLAKLGAEVTGIDENAALIAVAKQHQAALTIEYRCQTLQALVVERAAYYDIITCFEVLEHVADPQQLLLAAAKLLQPQGHLFCSTLHRSVLAYVAAIVVAEYCLGCLSPGTHDYSHFIRPAELSRWARQVGFSPKIVRGVHYSFLTKQFCYADRVTVNYFFYARQQTVNNDKMCFSADRA